MKTTCLILLLSASFYKQSDCSDALSAADDALTYADRAYDSDSWTDTKDYLKKSMNSFEDAQTYAQDCECDEAYSVADDGYDYARKGYNSLDWDDAKSNARRAKSSAEDLITYAEECDDEF